MTKTVRKPETVKPGKVQRIIKPAHRDDVEKAEIEIKGGDHLYKEIRIENTLLDQNDNPVKLKQGAEVEVVVKADPEETVAK